MVFDLWIVVASIEMRGDVVCRGVSCCNANFSDTRMHSFLGVCVGDDSFFGFVL